MVSYNLVHLDRFLQSVPRLAASRVDTGSRVLAGSSSAMRYEQSPFGRARLLCLLRHSLFLRLPSFTTPLELNTVVRGPDDPGCRPRVSERENGVVSRCSSCWPTTAQSSEEGCPFRLNRSRQLPTSSANTVELPEPAHTQVPCMPSKVYSPIDPEQRIGQTSVA